MKDTNILNDLQTYFEQEVTLAGTDLGSLEPAVINFIQQLGQGLLQRLVSKRPNGHQCNCLPCSCGSSMRFVGYRNKSIQTLLGWIDISRAYYHCPGCGSSSFPYDKASGLGGEHISPGLAMACCVVAVGDSFSQVSVKVHKLLGQYVSDKTVERVVHQVGSVQLAEGNQRLESFRQDRHIPDGDVAIKRLYIAADGTTVHEKDGWHESKIGVIWWQDERFEPHSRYVGGFEDAEDFGWRLWLEACSCGFRQAQDVVYLGDGAAWVRGIHDRHFKRATFIIDWYHASEHVWDCGKILFGQGSEATGRWVNERLALLWDGWTRKLLDDLRSERKRYRGSKRKALEDLYRYISSNEEQMRYDVFRAKGYQIGSGSVEGACKHVVGDRLKRSGMIWSPLGDA